MTCEYGTKAIEGQAQTSKLQFKTIPAALPLPKDYTVRTSSKSVTVIE